MGDKGDNTMRRYIVISGNGLSSCTCPVEQVPDMIIEFIGRDVQQAYSDPMDPVTLTETWLTDAEFDALGDWSP